MGTKIVFGFVLGLCTAYMLENSADTKYDRYDQHSFVVSPVRHTAPKTYDFMARSMELLPHDTQLEARENQRALIEVPGTIFPVIPEVNQPESPVTPTSENV